MSSSDSGRGGGDVRDSIVQNLILLQRVAYLEGVDAAQKGESRYNYALSPYLTDDLCAAIYTPTVSTSLTEVGFFDWEQPPQDWN
jgi:hypothetical protein